MQLTLQKPRHIVEEAEKQLQRTLCSSSYSNNNVDSNNSSQKSVYTGRSLTRYYTSYAHLLTSQGLLTQTPDKFTPTSDNYSIKDNSSTRTSVTQSSVKNKLINGHTLRKDSQASEKFKDLILVQPADVDNKNKTEH